MPQGHLLMVKNDDTPGVIGQIGTLLGARSVNIARMTVGRKPGSGRAVMLIEVESEPTVPRVSAVGSLSTSMSISARPLRACRPTPWRC